MNSGGSPTVYARPLARLIEQLQRLPGIGPKTAQRLALHILKRPETEIQALAQALVEAKQQIGLCSVCFHLSAEPVCEICRTETRDRNTLCVVADSRDVIAIEKTREYRGTLTQPAVAPRPLTCRKIPEPRCRTWRRLKPTTTAISYCFR